MSRRSAREVATWVLEIEAAAIHGLVAKLDQSFDDAIELIAGSRGRVICTGMGKSGIIMKKVAATLSSTGTPALFLHPAEAIHGDLGMLVEGDVVLAASFSGSTEELLRLVEIIKRLDTRLIVMTGNARSPLARHADVHLRIDIDKEACPLNLAPTASTSATLALGDALAMSLLERQGFTPDDFSRFHPGGQLGRKLLKAGQLMHSDDALPTVGLDSTLREAVAEMSAKGFGITAVVDSAGLLSGCLTDGDLRRLLEDGDPPLDAPISGFLREASPLTISANQLASAALKLMEDHRITSLFVVDETTRVEGILHLHDLWRLELF